MRIARQKKRCQLRGFKSPVEITSFECPKCQYHIQESGYCNRCGVYVEVPKEKEEQVKHITYKEYCKWILDNLDHYVIYEVKSKEHYAIVLLAREEDLKDFLENSPFKNYTKRKVKLRDLNAYLIKTNYRIVLTTREWNEIV